MGKEQVDARGKNCPEPVLMTKNAVSPDVTEVETLVDNPIARENVSRFMKSKGFSVECTENDGTISVRGVVDANPRPSATAFQKGAANPRPSATDEETKRPTQFADAHRSSAYPFQKGANPQPACAPYENGANDAA
jgi:TusA-related sulfurtransferase